MAASAFQVNKRRFVLPPGLSAELSLQFRDAPEQFGQMLNGDKLAFGVPAGCAGMPSHFSPSGMSFIKPDFAVAFVVALAFAA